MRYHFVSAATAQPSVLSIGMGCRIFLVLYVDSLLAKVCMCAMHLMCLYYAGIKAVEDVTAVVATSKK